MPARRRSGAHPLSFNDRSRLHFNQPFGANQAVNDHKSARWRILRVHVFISKVLKHLFGPSGKIVFADEGAGFIEHDLPGDINELAARHLGYLPVATGSMLRIANVSELDFGKTH